MNMAKHFLDAEVYRGAMEMVMSVFELTKKFPADEKQVLSDQIRRSSRSVCANLAEAWRKRSYLAAFVSKLNDAETEAAETQLHLEVALRHRYITSEIFENLDDACDKVLGQIVSMIDHADRWIIKPRRQISNG
jgi:four helix bundle protein